jgi:hypothetical protein
MSIDDRVSLFGSASRSPSRPQVYADADSFRPWLRHDFAFRCARILETGVEDKVSVNRAIKGSTCAKKPPRFAPPK